VPILKLFHKPFFLIIAFGGVVSCSDETDEIPSDSSLKNRPAPIASAPIDEPDNSFPVVYIEELDQFQEYYKDQHTTSFSHVPSKNWFSFTAAKDGTLTKILLYGKANVVPNEYYGTYMSGFIREGNPTTGPKYGSWKLSRDDILNQFSAQSLTETDSGWITIRMRGKIPQERGQTYFFVCDSIPERPWFGEFAFGDGNPYKAGRNWLNSEHDLVFRTYVGQTKEQIEEIQMIRKIKEFKSAQDNNKSSVTANAPPPSPIRLSPNPLPPESFQQAPAEQERPAPKFSPTQQRQLLPSSPPQVDDYPPTIEPLNISPERTNIKSVPASAVPPRSPAVEQNKSKSLLNRLFRQRQ
jgi:hypothetical protein